jgi:hypothetical protein
MSATIARVRGITFFVLHPKRLLALLGGILAAIVYVWFAAVGAVPGVRRRKTAAREAWRTRPRRTTNAA